VLLQILNKRADFHEPCLKVVSLKAISKSKFLIYYNLRSNNNIVETGICTIWRASVAIESGNDVWEIKKHKILICFASNNMAIAHDFSFRRYFKGDNSQQ